MDPEDIKLYFSNIEEYVYDEKKIVTYSWLSKILGIHANLAKQLLYTFFERSSKKEELSLTYLIIGSSKDCKIQQVLIVKDKELQEVENSLESITSKHIYSIQRSLEPANINVLYAAEKQELIDNISKGVSAIDFNCNERDNEILTKLKLNALPEASNQSAAPSKKVNPPAPVKIKSPIKSNEPEDDKTSGIKPENKKPSIPSMFGSAAGQKKKPAEKVATNNNKKPNNKKSQGIGAFFAKTTNRPTCNEPKKVVESSKPEEENKPENEATTDSKVAERLSPQKENKATLNIEKDIKTKEGETPKSTQTESKKLDAKSKTAKDKKADTKRGKKKPAKKEDKNQKQRKRLVVMSDSDSNHSSEEEEVQREPTPEPQPMVVVDDEDDDIISATPEPSKKRKKRKLVCKTFTDEEGYMVTRKEYVDVDVDVSCSEGEEEAAPEKKFKESTSPDSYCAKPSEPIPDKKEAKTATKTKKSSPKNKNPSPQKSKQASLMSFFKKK